MFREHNGGNISGDSAVCGDAGEEVATRVEMRKAASQCEEVMGLLVRTVCLLKKHDRCHRKWKTRALEIMALYEQVQTMPADLVDSAMLRLCPIAKGMIDEQSDAVEAIVRDKQIKLDCCAGLDASSAGCMNTHKHNRTRPAVRPVAPACKHTNKSHKSDTKASFDVANLQPTSSFLCFQSGGNGAATSSELVWDDTNIAQNTNVRAYIYIYIL